MHSFFKNKKILITGACGTIGREIVRQLLEDFDVSELVGIDNNESELFFLEQNFSKYQQTHFYLADIRDKAKVERATRDMNVIFHTAAFKHVILCERSPFEAVQTNLLGIQNLISAASRNKVDRVIFTSSDKAVNPTNVMGTSKLMGERLITAANSNSRDNGPIFSSTRFGNVLGSRGSVIPIFREQIRRGGPVTLTHPEMTRFIMSIEEAVRLVIDSAFLMKGGEVFITKMPVICIKDLADVMIETLAPEFGHRPSDISIEIIGEKPGEKMYEELMNHEETRRSLELPRYFSVLPAFKGLYRCIRYEYPEVVSDRVAKAYHSGNETPLSKMELHDFLIENRLLHRDPDECKHPQERYWP